jgi:hypothetical protein
MPTEFFVGGRIVLAKLMDAEITYMRTRLPSCFVESCQLLKKAWKGKLQGILALLNVFVCIIFSPSTARPSTQAFKFSLSLLTQKDKPAVNGWQSCSLIRPYLPLVTPEIDKLEGQINILLEYDNC